MNLIYLILNRKRLRNYEYNSSVTENHFNLISSIKKSPIKNSKVEFRLIEILGIDYDENRKNHSFTADIKNFRRKHK